MNLYLLTQDENTGYDTYDSCVVVAEDEESARLISPTGVLWRGDPESRYKGWHSGHSERFSSWASRPESVTVKFIGTAAPELTSGDVVCASFNAG